MASSSAGKPSAKYVGARRRLRLWMMFMVVFFGWCVYTFFTQSVQLNSNREQLVGVAKSLNETTQARDELKQEIVRLNDPEYIGQVARKKQGLYLPGETPIKVNEP
ncbi:MULTISPECIES: septum formation initiator family protein [unclassified Paenibacillus]|uniref:FtsB family cell division protein n=1 Tax=unclassified Paenibacillus TaxID=185978 RepID=UPI001C0FF7E7|nr:MULTISPECIES: septum formation initiator family protein [unclassified Paenibacillus]MBU5444124.1 septum formation initiator family protein [Paenibacillus sp. MSJ-34]CAH0122002.1 Cell division protein FtsL [Paenibacillus sp. CECT 9249]